MHNVQYKILLLKNYEFQNTRFSYSATPKGPNSGYQSLAKHSLYYYRTVKLFLVWINGEPKMMNEVSLREEDYNEHGYSHAPVTVRSAPQQPNSDCGVHARWTTEMGTGGFKSRTAVVLSAHIIAGYPLIWTPRVLICGRLFTEGIYAIKERQIWIDLRWVT